MSKVGTPPPHNLDKTHGLVESINNNNSVGVQRFYAFIFIGHISHTYIYIYIFIYIAATCAARNYMPCALIDRKRRGQPEIDTERQKERHIDI